MRYAVAPVLAAADMKCLEKYGTLNEEDVAFYLGVDKTTVRRWRRKETLTMGLELADRCSMALGLHIETLWPESQMVLSEKDIKKWMASQ